MRNVAIDVEDLQLMPNRCQLPYLPQLRLPSLRRRFSPPPPLRSPLQDLKLLPRIEIVNPPPRSQIS